MKGWTMNLSKDNVKNLLLVVCGGAAVYAAVQHLDVLWRALMAALGVFAPFLLGASLAFILNVPMRSIERHVFPRERQMDRLRRPLALIFALLAVIGVLVVAMWVIIPGVKDAVLSAASQVPDAVDALIVKLQGFAVYLPALGEYLAGLELDWNSIAQKVMKMVQDWGGGLLSSGSGLIGGVVSGVSTFVIGFIFSIYILLQKEKLGRQGKQVLYALLPLEKADRVLDILRLAERTFSSFLSGQCLEAVILGCIFVIAMTLFKMPYALLVGVLIALMALVPIVGAFIGCAVGALLIALTDPIQALVFVALFLVLQQIEGNLIYPHVVGSSVGLPSIWVLAAVTLGGKLMGVVGMLVFIPLCSVLYALFRDYVKRRLAEKRVPEGKWKGSP